MPWGDTRGSHCQVGVMVKVMVRVMVGMDVQGEGEDGGLE